MAKAVVRVTSDFNELVTDLLSLADDLPGVMMEPLMLRWKFLNLPFKSNWVSLVPWGRAGDYVYDSIGYNTEYGDSGSDVVGMAGVFLIDSVGEEHGKNEKYQISRGPNKGKYKAHIKAPQLAYWAEFGYSPNNGAVVPGYPFLGNAFYMTVSQQDYIFAEVLDASIKVRLGT